MNFYGFKKTTLIDFPGKIACTVFTHGCNFRCPFCHNPELVTGKPKRSEAVSEKEILQFLKKRIGKLDGIVFTGGEPLLHTDTLVPLLRKIKTLGFLIKVDTNGTFPEELELLAEEKLVDFVAMDFKTQPENYSAMGAGTQDVEKVLQSLEFLSLHTLPHEIRTTLVPGIHTEDIIKKLVSVIPPQNTYVLQNFVPNGTIDPSYKHVKPFPPERMQAFLAIAQKILPKAILRDQQ